MKTVPILIFMVGGFFVSVVWLLVVSGAVSCIKTDQLEPLFTGLGFVGLVATFWHERAKSEEAEHEHNEVLAEMRRNTQMSTQANQIAIMTARIRYLSDLMAEMPELIKKSGFFTTSSERKKLIEELAEIGKPPDPKA